MTLKHTTLFLLCSMLAACGGEPGDRPEPGPGVPEEPPEEQPGDGNGNDNPSDGDGEGSASTETRRGFFLDAAVVNLDYATDTEQGVTTEAGMYEYRAGETVTFSIGDLTLPRAPAMATLTPLDLAGTSDIEHQTVINIARLLQTLDVDGDPSNGITIDDQAKGAATQINFDQPADDFATDNSVVNLINNSGSSNTALVSVEQARTHLQTTLNNQVLNYTQLSAEASDDTYALINSTLGGEAVESPVCDYSTDPHGPRITEVQDEDLQEPVFAFHIYKDIDGDRCIADITDRQRIEIKTYNGSPAVHTASEGEIHTYRWKFKLPEGFQPTSSFTHIFQIKAAGGEDDGMPIVTFTPRAGSPEQLEILHAPSEASAEEVASAELADFKGKWVEAYVRTRNSEQGSLEITLRRLDDGVTLVNWSNNEIDMWREGASINRPKWGIYRSLNNAGDLRDETVWFNDFCIAEGTNMCPSALDPVTPQPGSGGSIGAQFDFEGETLPEQFQTNGPVEISNAQSNDGSQSVKLSKTGGENAQLRHEFGAKTTGVATASLYIPSDVEIDTVVTLYSEGYSASSGFRSIDVLFKPDGTIRAREAGTQNQLDVTYNHDSWNDIEIAWEDVDTTNTFTLKVNGQQASIEGRTDLGVDQTGLTPERIEFKFGNKSDESATSIYVDSVSVRDSLAEPGTGEGGDGGNTPEPDIGFEADSVGSAPAAFDQVDGDITVTDERGRYSEQSLVLAHAVEGDVRVRKQLESAATGALEVSVYIPELSDADLMITTYEGSYSGSERAIDVIFKNSQDNVKVRQGSSQNDVAKYTTGEWVDVRISWEDIATSGQFTLEMNGSVIGTFDVTTPGKTPDRFEIKYGYNSGNISNVKVYVDNISGF